MKEQCKICNREFKNVGGLSPHISKTHKITLQEYYDIYLTKGNEKYCPMCNEENSFSRLNDGYSNTCSYKCAGLLITKNKEDRKEKENSELLKKIQNNKVGYENYLICKICDKISKSKKALLQHLRNHHDITKEEYHLRYYKKDSDINTCIICGNKTKFFDIINGYKRTCSSKCNCKDPERNKSVSKGLQKVRAERNDEINEKRFNTCRLIYGCDGATGHPDIQQKIKNTFIGKIGVDHNSKTKEWKENQSKIMSEKYINGFFNYRTGNKNSGHFFSTKNNKELYYRSSFELAAYKILEQLSKVYSYEAEPFAIPYTFEGINRRYIPDILVTYTDDTKELIEVKPEYLVKDEKVQLKNEAAEIYCKENNIDKFSIWTEKEIFINN